MSINAMAGRLITVHRRTAFILDSVATTATPGVLGPDRQPVVAGIIAVAVAGTPSSFSTITISGDVDGSPDTEVLTFTAVGEKRTIKEFDEATLVITMDAGWGTGGTVTSRSIAVDGAPNHVTTTIVAGWRMHLNRGAASWRNTAAGVAQIERTIFAWDYTTQWTPREGDVFVDDGSTEQWKVVGTPDWLGGIRPHHWEARVERDEGALTT